MPNTSGSRRDFGSNNKPAARFPSQCIGGEIVEHPILSHIVIRNTGHAPPGQYPIGCNLRAHKKEPDGFNLGTGKLTAHGHRIDFVLFGRKQDCRLPQRITVSLYKITHKIGRIVLQSQPIDYPAKTVLCAACIEESFGFALSDAGFLLRAAPKADAKQEQK